ncbi:esterase/lipase family protein [Limnobaculum zhutongyuii]|uniref:esterase/lipase family protein n=1 Tax=Limnobaculum zhutongyuii TaxID=2498113 RepID=UPI001FE7322F|nr:hypothetical protein [Limnobaculum zhutongyuii]
MKTKTDNPDETDELWRLDSALSLINWSYPNSDARKRKLKLDPDLVEVDSDGLFYPYVGVSQLNALSDQYKIDDNSTAEEIEAYQEALARLMADDPEAKLFGGRKERGWGEVARLSYGEFLDTLQHALHRDKLSPSGICQQLVGEILKVEHSRQNEALENAELKVLEQYLFPVHAMGYCWLGSNADSANALAKRIESIQAFYRDKGFKCHKVILVTHSMGGLVARYYSEVLGGNAQIYGVVHGVLPSVGAAATYTRMKRGTENPLSDIAGYVTTQILGRDAAEMTAVCAQSPGALQLLPAPEYGMGWLNIIDRHGNKESYPKVDPYSEIYTCKDKWWRLVDPHLLNPLNERGNKWVFEQNWKGFENIIYRHVKKFQSDISGKYHPNTYSFYGLDDSFVSKVEASHTTQQTAIWKGTLWMAEENTYPVPSSALPGEQLDKREVMQHRTISDVLSANERDYQIVGTGGPGDYRQRTSVYVGQRFTLQDAAENGDGTVPVISGVIADKHLVSRLPLKVEHEPAYKKPIAQKFTLRAIIKIAQEVNNDPLMAFKA